MKIALGSDLHIEFGMGDLPKKMKNTENVDVLILSGDVFIGEALNKLGNKHTSTDYEDFIELCVQEYPQIVYVTGNHEYYHGYFKKTNDTIKKALEKYPTFHFLNNETLKIDDILFVGTTLWTNLNNFHRETMYVVQSMMNDYRKIINDDIPGGAITPKETGQKHIENMEFLRKVLSENVSTKTVVVGHHAPSPMSIKPQYANDWHINGAYSSNLEEFILDNPNIVLWTHGHTHSPFDYMIGSTRVVCNPRGYWNYEDISHSFELQHITI